MNSEAKLINAVCNNGDISTILEQDVDALFTSHKDVWESVKDYWYDYRTTPSVKEIAEKHRDFDVMETPGPTKAYLDELRNDYLKTRLRNMFMEQTQELKGKAGAEVLQDAFQELSRLNRLATNVRDVDLSNYEEAARMYKARQERAAVMGGTVGIPTGFAAIDSAYPTGMAPGHLIVVIGWPGRGKTWATSYMACKAYDAGFKPMIVSLEMAPETMRDRIYTMMGQGTFRNSQLSRGDLNLDDFASWGKRRFDNKGGFVLVSSEGAGGVNANTIQAKIDQHRPDLVILDYHQLFEDARGAKSTTEQNKNISRDFKLLAVNNNLPVIDITAATMDDVSDQDSPPMLSQVAWSKAIEYDADMAMAVHKAPESNVIEITSRKNRHGGEFSFYLDWDIDRGIITEITG